MRQTTASAAPAAPSRCPLTDFVELTRKVFAPSPAQRLMAAASRRIIVRGGRAVRVEVVNLPRQDFCAGAGSGHRGQGRIAFGMRLREVMRVGRRAVADDFAQNFRTAFSCMPSVSKVRMAAPSPSVSPSRCASNGRQGVVESAWSESNPANVSWHKVS